MVAAHGSACGESRYGWWWKAGTKRRRSTARMAACTRGERIRPAESRLSMSAEFVEAEQVYAIARGRGRRKPCGRVTERAKVSEGWGGMGCAGKVEGKMLAQEVVRDGDTGGDL